MQRDEHRLSSKTVFLCYLFDYGRKSPVTILVLFENWIDEDEYGSIMLASVLVWNLESCGVMN